MLSFDSSGNLVTFHRQNQNAAPIVVLKDSDLNLGRKQGEVGLTTLDAGYDFGYVPNWLVNQRLTNLVYQWPVNLSIRFLLLVITQAVEFVILSFFYVTYNRVMQDCT